ncbi:MAG: transporter [Syntrophales bacterium]
MALRRGNTVGAVLCLAMIVYASPVPARDGGLRLDGAASAAVGAGLEVSHGDYGAGADATLVTVPLSFFWCPADKIDINIEVPLLSLSSKAGSGVVVTSSGGAGRGRGANRSGGTAGGGATTVRESGVGDINMTAGWTLLQEGEQTPRVRPTFYLKVPSGDLDRGLGTGTLEAGPGISVSKWMGRFQLFGEGAYIFQNSKSDYPGRNYVSYLGGAGIQTTDRLFVSVQARGSSARSDGAEAQAEGRLQVNFMQSRRISWEIYGAAGFTNASPDFGGGMAMLYQF